MNQIQDTKGNYLAMSYDENNENGEYYLTRIDYTGDLQVLEKSLDLNF